MKIIKIHHPLNQKLGLNKPSVIAMGLFDGLHLGHQAVIKKAKSIADSKNLPLGVLTYDHHPKVVYEKMNYFDKSYITTRHEKMHLLKIMGVQFVYLINYTYDFQKQTPQEFVNNYLMKMNLDTVVAGFDHTYGNNINGNSNMHSLPKYFHNKVNVVTVPAKMIDDIKISSTQIKNNLTNGNIELTNEYLGRTFTTYGLIVHGYARGRKLGFPTINVEHHEYQLLPKVGVYVVKVKINNHFYKGMASIGHNVTFGSSNPITVEINIFNFNHNVYGEYVTIYWKTMIRKQIKFSSVNALIKRLNNDRQYALNYFGKQN